MRQFFKFQKFQFVYLRISKPSHLETNVEFEMTIKNLNEK